MNNKLTILNYLALLLGIIFSVLQIHLKADISMLAFISSAVFTGALFFVSLFLVQKNISITGIKAMAKMYEYAPFVYLIVFVLRRAGKEGTSQVYDIITVLLWLAILVLVFFIRYQLNGKRVYDLNPLFAEKLKGMTEKKLPVGLRVIREIIGWVDALVWAVFAVALINVFVFQLYEIPSESMVPEFLVKDRVAVIKIADGPKFPLSDVGLPRIRKYTRGDIVVFNNPHYKQDRQAELKKFTSQLVYMFTLMKVNLNVDENGNLKADPLVKRVCGVPGEQLVMVDGVLYKRTSQTNTFTAVTDDAKWAEWNLAGLPLSTREKVRDIRLLPDEYQEMLDIENTRRNLSVTTASTECKDLAIQFAKIKNDISGNSNTNLVEGNIEEFLQSNTTINLFSSNDLYIYNFFKNFDSITRKLLSVKDGEIWFANFMTNWILNSKNISTEPSELIGGDAYSDAMFRMNLMAKLCFGRLAVAYAEATEKGQSISILSANPVIAAELSTAQNLTWYMSALNDLRNMPVFPKNNKDGSAQYIPDNSYFMMGDNRFNSLDMRHSYEYKMTNITDYDSYSLQYNSNMAPQYVNDSEILGTTILRIYPFNRFGVPGLTAEKSK